MDVVEIAREQYEKLYEAAKQRKAQEIDLWGILDEKYWEMIFARLFDIFLSLGSVTNEERLWTSRKLEILDSATSLRTKIFALSDLVKYQQ